jgi:hypothetical protein
MARANSARPFVVATARRATLAGWQPAATASRTTAAGIATSSRNAATVRVSVDGGAGAGPAA